MSKIKGSSLAGTGTNERIDNDFYATDPKSVNSFFNHFNIKGESVWEPAAGAGHISEVLKNKFSEVYSSDLIDRGQGFDEIDFLQYQGNEKYDWVITNPPFKQAQQFIEKALTVSNIGVAMFLKIQFLEGVGRKDFLMSSPLKYVYVFSKRQNIFTNGEEFDENGKRRANTMCFSWFVWEHGYQGEPIIRWL